MALTSEDYNAFARALTDRFSRRAKGLDDASQRLVGVRPADHVLTGFLTPGGKAEEERHEPGNEEGVEHLDAVVAGDLPRDSAYEQSTVGLEWLAPHEGFAGGGDLEIVVRSHVFVRRLPSFLEQRTHTIWRATKAVVTGAPAPEVAPGRETDLAAVWSREALPPMTARVPIERLWQERKIPVDLAGEVVAWWNDHPRDGLFPGRRPVTITEHDLATEDAFGSRLASLGNGRCPVAWHPVLDVRVANIPTEKGAVCVTVRLRNLTARERGRTLEYVDPNLYGIDLAVSLPSRLHRPSVFRELPSSFRYDRRMPGVGINADVVREPSTPDRVVLRAETVPRKEIDRLEPREIPGAPPRFDVLATDPLPCLEGIRAAMHAYDDVWATRVSALDGIEREEATRSRERFAEERERFSRGLDLLRNERYPHVRQAFVLMNDAMRLTARHYQEWRLFQIVFIVSQLPGLGGREYPELAMPGDENVDILWFAAGGGKTEAFLGVIIWQSLFDRLRGKKAGVTAFVRFPLRLLTFQQLQRLGRGLAAAELVRAREGLGGARFSIGYFSGRSVTPNKINDELHRRFIANGVDERFRRVFTCPFPECTGRVTVQYEPALRLLTHVCTNTACPGGTARLPIYVVDDDLYRYLPTVIVSTVDKLALIGHNSRFANLFGRIDLLCHEHGASFRDSNAAICPAAKEYTPEKPPPQCGAARVTYGPFHDAAPALLIQDELHLLSEELGTFDAHYETGTMALARGLDAAPWKIIAATATIEQYAQHAWQLYLKRARQFPGPGPGAYASFYYQQDATRVGRVFVGVLGIGRKHTPAVTRTLALLYLELQAARELYATNPDAASQTYGTRVLDGHDAQSLVFAYELPLTYVLTRKGSDQVAEAIESRVKKELRELAPEHGELLVDMFNGGVDVSEMIEAMERIRTADPLVDPSTRLRGLVTTNIIGHGVDVDRFNIMVFAGFTRLVAEYIQASARVGRTLPGISVFVATPQSERDRSIFDRFAKFHEYLDRLVDPSAVNRWPEAALARTVPGLLCGYLLGVASRKVGRVLSTVERVQAAFGTPGAEALGESAVLAWMEEAYGVQNAPTPEYRTRLATHTNNAYRQVVSAPAQTGRRPRSLNTLLAAMRSLRDVDDPGFIRIGNQDEAAMLERFLNG